MADRRTVKPPRKLDNQHYRFIDDCMAEDDELIVTKLRDKLRERFPTLNVSMSTVKRASREMGWTAKKTIKVWCVGVGSESRKASGLVQGTDGDWRHGF